MKVLATIWHTGTQYAMHNIVPDAKQIHCNHPDLWRAVMLSATELHTTFRNPYDVAASWGNNYPRIAEVEADWFGQWEDWGRVMDVGAAVHFVKDFDQPKIGSKPDRNNMRHYLERRDMMRFHDIIPRAWLDHAIDIIRAVAYDQPDVKIAS